MTMKQKNRRIMRLYAVIRFMQAWEEQDTKTLVSILVLTLLDAELLQMITDAHDFLTGKLTELAE